ncbi:MAG: right-handed parallel beta-helix repeat-containing protein [Chthoniobacteraceae bacterium]
MLPRLFIFAVVISVVTAARASIWFVAPDGRDEESAGTLDRPWKTPGYSATRAKAGDTVFVEAGTYANFGIKRSGSKAGGSITFQSQTPHMAKIRCESPEYVDCITVEADYIKINGFELENVRAGNFGSGVFARNHHHIAVQNCLIHGMGGAGVGFDHCDYLLAEGNVIHDTAMWNPYMTSAISFYMNRAFEGVDDGPGFRNVIRSNTCYHNYNDRAAIGKETTDGNGIIIDTFHGDASTPAYIYPTLVKGNVCFDNGGKGIHVFQSDHVTALSNICYHNNWDPGNTGTWRAELSNVQSNHNHWINNVGVALVTKTGAVTDANKAIMNVHTGDYDISDVDWTENISFNGTTGDISLFNNGPDTALAVSKGNKLGVDPLFIHPGINPFTCDFHMRKSLW